MMGVITNLVLFSSLLSMFGEQVLGDPVRVAYSVHESVSTSTSSSLKGPPGTVRHKQFLPIAESTLPHAPVLREMSESDQHDMSTSTPSSESLESQLQSPHVIRKKALVDFDTSADDLLQTLEML